MSGSRHSFLQLPAGTVQAHPEGGLRAPERNRAVAAVKALPSDEAEDLPLALDNCASATANASLRATSSVWSTPGAMGSLASLLRSRIRRRAERRWFLITFAAIA